MKKSVLFSLLLSAFAVFSAFQTSSEKLVSNKMHVKFFSTTPAEDIEANNYKGTGTLNAATGEMVYSIPMQSFEFEIAMMQKHFNQPDFLDTKAFPKAKFVGSITNLSEINFEKDGEYKAQVKGDLTIKGKTNPVTETGTITVKQGVITAHSVFNVTLADYEIAFSKGKPSTNVAKTVKVTVHAEFTK